MAELISSQFPGDSKARQAMKGKEKGIRQCYTPIINLGKGDTLV